MTVAKTLSTPTLHWARIGRARRFIRDHADEPLTLERIAAAAATSPYHFARIFRALTGETVFTHVSRVRLRRAADLLLERGCTVTQVAVAVGYGTAPSFNRLFRRTLGLTPTEYRARSAAERAPLLDRLGDPDTTPAGGHPTSRFLCVRRRGLCPEEAPVAWASFTASPAACGSRAPGTSAPRTTTPGRSASACTATRPGSRFPTRLRCLRA